jgi:hyperosmotically inducible protein
MKATHPLALVVAVAALLGSTVALRASNNLDERIEFSFKDSIDYQVFLRADHIEINSKDGAVTLSGDVFDPTHLPLAENIAEALPGVKSVDNCIVVLVNTRPPVTDAALNNGIRRIPFRSNQAPKDLTTGDPQSAVAGNQLENEMPIAKASETPAVTLDTSLNDASITARVKKSLSSHRWTKALETTVTTNNGIVSISGKAGTGAQRDSVTQLVTDVQGVRSVINRMVVDDTLSKND